MKIYVISQVPLRIVIDLEGAHLTKAIEFDDTFINLLQGIDPDYSITVMHAVFDGRFRYNKKTGNVELIDEKGGD